MILSKKKHVLSWEKFREWQGSAVKIYKSDSQILLTTFKELLLEFAGEK